MHEERTIDLPFSFDRVWDAARIVFDRSQWRVSRADKPKGHYEIVLVLRIGRLDYIPRLEKFDVDLTILGENSTRVHAEVQGRQLHWGTTRSHVDSFVIELQKILGQQTPSVEDQARTRSDTAESR